jgi:hypothetical protein
MSRRRDAAHRETGVRVAEVRRGVQRARRLRPRGHEPTGTGRPSEGADVVEVVRHRGPDVPRVVSRGGCAQPKVSGSGAIRGTPRHDPSMISRTGRRSRPGCAPTPAVRGAGGRWVRFSRERRGDRGVMTTGEGRLGSFFPRLIGCRRGGSLGSFFPGRPGGSARRRPSGFAQNPRCPAGFVFPTERRQTVPDGTRPGFVFPGRGAPRRGATLGSFFPRRTTGLGSFFPARPGWRGGPLGSFFPGALAPPSLAGHQPPATRGHRRRDGDPGMVLISDGCR